MTVTSRHRGGPELADLRQAEEQPPAKQRVGRPKLDRSLDRLEWQTGLKANRGMIAWRALGLFLASHTTENAVGREREEAVLSSITAIVAHNRRGYSRLSHITGARMRCCPSRRARRRNRLFLQEVK
jgi:hypothetical protein